MKHQIKQKGAIQIPLLIGIIVSIIITSGMGYSFFEYNKVSNLVEEASQLIKGESFIEANSKLELANNKVIVGVLGIKKKEIKNMMNNNEKLSEDKSNYNQGIEEFNNENWEQAEEFLLKISEISPYYQAAKNKIEDTQNNIIQEKIIRAIEEIKKEGDKSLSSPVTPRTIPDTTPICTDECAILNQKRCINNYYQTCGNYDMDSCLEWSSLIYCPYGCESGQCKDAPTTAPQQDTQIKIEQCKAEAQSKIATDQQKVNDLRLQAEQTLIELENDLNDYRTRYLFVCIKDPYGSSCLVYNSEVARLERNIDEGRKTSNSLLQSAQAIVDQNYNKFYSECIGK